MRRNSMLSVFSKSSYTKGRRLRYSILNSIKNDILGSKINSDPYFGFDVAKQFVIYFPNNNLENVLKYYQIIN